MLPDQKCLLGGALQRSHEAENVAVAPLFPPRTAFEYSPALAALLRPACSPLFAISPHTHSLLYRCCEIFQPGGVTEAQTKASTESVSLVVNQLGFPEGNKFWLRCAALYAIHDPLLDKACLDVFNL